MQDPSEREQQGAMEGGGGEGGRICKCGMSFCSNVGS